MGQKIIDYYKQAEEHGKLKAKMRMAMITGVPSAEAGSIPDTDENIKKFEAALAEIKKGG